MRPKLISASICLCVALTSQPACNLSLLRNSRRVDAITGILEAFRSHQIVALGEGIHGNNQAHAVRLALIFDPRFAAVVNDIVVEFGSARYQALMDRFVSGGEVPYAELRKAWQDTALPHAGWDLPIYEAFFRAVREVNALLPADRHLRVLLGDPPIDWSVVRTREDVGRGLASRGHVMDVIKQEVLSKNRRALVVYGDGHLRRYSKWRGIDGPAGPTLLNRIEREGAKAFAIWTNTTVQLERLQKDIGTWPIPSLTVVRGTRLGALDFKHFAGMETDPPTRMEQQYDAVLYLGPVSSITFAELPAALCSDAEYTKMRLARTALGPGGPTGPDAVEFNRQCARFLRQPQK